MADFPAIPLILDRKAPGHVHIVAGDLRCQIDFLAETIAPGRVDHVRRVALDRLEDAPVIEALQGQEPTLFLLEREARLSIAADTRARVGVWTAAPLRKRTAALRLLMRQAMTLMQRELDAEHIDFLGDTVLEAVGDDAAPQAMIWEAAWHLTGPDPGTPPAGLYVQPWEQPWGWTQEVAPLSKRLHILYNDLAAYVFGLDDDWKCAQLLGTTPRKYQWVKTLKLNLGQVERALTALSKWRTQADPNTAYHVALAVSQVFAE